MENIAMLSYGKDSLAQLLVMAEKGIKIDGILTADLWATETIPAYLPELFEFRQRMDEEIKEELGIAVTHVRSEKNFEELFYKPLTARSKYEGIYGWPPVFGHWCMRIMKQEPIHRYLKGRDCCEWIAIAADETARLRRLNDRLRSALAENGIIEEMAMEMCRKKNWVSPTYMHSGRDGCWFCICQGTEPLRRLYNEFPEYWSLMMKWDADTNKRFKIDHTLPEYDRRFYLESQGLIDPKEQFKWSMLNQELNYSLFAQEGL